MKTSLLLISIFLINYVALSQPLPDPISYEKYGDSLIYIKTLPTDSKKKGMCGDKLYWDIVKFGPDVVPQLLNKITDTTITSIRIPCRDSYLRIGDLAYLLIDEIIWVPLAKVTESQWCLLEIGCDFGQSVGVFEYLDRNRSEFSKLLIGWFAKYKSSFYKRSLTLNELNGCRAKAGINYMLDCEY